MCMHGNCTPGLEPFVPLTALSSPQCFFGLCPLWYLPICSSCNSFGSGTRTCVEIPYSAACAEAHVHVLHGKCTLCLSRRWHRPDRTIMRDWWGPTSRTWFLPHPHLHTRAYWSFSLSLFLSFFLSLIFYFLSYVGNLAHYRGPSIYHYPARQCYTVHRRLLYNLRLTPKYAPPSLLWFQFLVNLCICKLSLLCFRLFFSCVLFLRSISFFLLCLYVVFLCFPLPLTNHFLFLTPYSPFISLL